MNGLPLFDAAKATEAREEGIARADRGASLEFHAQALAAVRYLCKTQDEFSSDNIWSFLAGVECHEGRAMGAVLRRARALKLIEKVEGKFIMSERVSRHRAPIQVWRPI